MNEAAKLVADSALGLHFETIFIGGKAYAVGAPTIKIICRMISHWAEIDLSDKEQTLSQVFSSIPKNYIPVLKGLAVMTTGDVRFWRLKAVFLSWRWSRGKVTPGELKAAKDIVMQFTAEAAKDFFDCAASLQSVAGMAARAK